MNFFEQQDRAERNTKHLFVLLFLAVMSLVALTTLLLATVFYFGHNSSRPDVSVWQGITESISLSMVFTIALGVCAVICLGSIYKLIQLSSGGRAVAEAMGGHLVNPATGDADEKKLLNVVEEMAIASGTPVPLVYLLEDEAINAFAAGHSPQDAVIGVTRGCIQLLKRDELQGVIAHEFSHIFHGDMKLNMRLVGLLNGILLLGLLGDFLIRSNDPRFHLSSSKHRLPIGMTALGLGLMIIGYSGTFFGNLIKSAVSRQREFLADGSAVKFTRNPEGIAGALKKIGGHTLGSELSAHNAAEYSHMYFGAGLSGRFLTLLATHPPLSERIKRIQPHWDGEFPAVEFISYKSKLHTRNSIEQTPELAPIEFIVNIDQVLQSITQPSAAHLDYAQQTITAINQTIHDAARNPWDAQALMLGLLLDKDDNQQQQQWQLLGKLFTADEITFLKKPALDATRLEASLRLPVLELSLPALKQLSPGQYQRFKEALQLIIRADDHVNLVEWSFYRILIHNLEPYASPTRSLDFAQLHDEAIILLSAIAHAGAESGEDAKEAFNSGKSILGLEDAQPLRTDYSLADVNRAVTRLNHLKPLQKPLLLKALIECVLKDGKITVDEAELFRAIADSLDCPIPPILAAKN